jgi:hypothetical protein
MTTKTKSKKPKTEDEAQSRRFIEMAHELECDDDEAAFDERLRRLAKATPKPTTPKPNDH